MRIKKDLIDKIYLQGEADAPFEACGYLAGKNDQILEYFPMKNMDHSSEHFSLDPKEQFSVTRLARQEGLEILAVYHTHTATPPRPSDEDLKLAHDPGIIYVIVSLAQGKRTSRAYRIVKGKVSEEKIIIEV